MLFHVLLLHFWYLFTCSCGSFTHTVVHEYVEPGDPRSSSAPVDQHLGCFQSLWLTQICGNPPPNVPEASGPDFAWLHNPGECFVGPEGMCLGEHPQWVSSPLLDAARHPGVFEKSKVIIVCMMCCHF